MVEEQVDMENISLYGYIRNTPLDTEVHVEHQLRADRNNQPEENNTQDNAKLGGTKELGGSVSKIRPALGRGLIPTTGQLSESEEEYLKLRVKQLICHSLNEMRIRQSLPQPYTPWTGMQVPWKVQHLGAGVQGLWSNPRARAAVDCRETDQREVREEVVVGNAGGGKLGGHGSKAILLSHV